MSIALDATPASAGIDDGPTPLAVMLATMRWAHAAAEAACTHMTELAGPNAVVAAKAALALRAFVLKTAQAAAPYVHARLKAAAAPDPDRIRSHEEWLADMERAAAETDQQRATQQDHAGDARPPAAAPESNGPPLASTPREAHGMIRGARGMTMSSGGQETRRMGH